MVWTDDRAPLGAWSGAIPALRRGAPALASALSDLAKPLHVVRDGAELAVATSGQVTPGRRPGPSDRPLLGWAPALLPHQLGDP